MESADDSNPSHLGVRTVADIEVGAVTTPSSPPATELDRVNFQKLLLQMNGVSLASKGETSGKDSSQILKTSDINMKAQDKVTEAGPTTSQDQEKQKKKKKKSGKKSNKPSPTDSPQKILSEKETKKEQHTTVAQNISQTLKATTGSTSKLEKKEQPTVAKASQPSKASQQTAQSKVLSEASLGRTKGQVKPKEQPRQSSTEQFLSKISKEPTFANEFVENDSESLEIFKKQPLLLLKAAMNLIKPKKKISSFQDLNLFYCIPCDREFSDLDKHFEKAKEGHIFRWKCEMRRRTIDLLPDLSTKHLSLLDDLVLTTVEKCKTPQEDLQIAHIIWHTLDTLAKAKFKDCSVRWFGSHANEIALSDNKLLNMDLLVSNKEEAASTFLNYIAAVEEVYSKVERVVATNFAHANIFHEGLVVQLSLNNNGAYNTAKLIRDYISIDNRVKPLCIFFRYWGKMCGLDQGENGSWQGHAFPIMVIHFLQQRQVLPVLHDMLDNPDGTPEVYLDPRELQGRWYGRNKESVGNLLFKLFRYYAIEHDVEKHVVSITQFKPFLRQSTKWNAKRIAVIDPFQPKHNISRYISANMYDYVHFCLVTTTCSLGIPRSEAGPLFGFIGPRPEPSLFDQTPSVLKEYLSVSEKIYELILRLDNSYDVPDLQSDNEENVQSLREELNSSRVYRELYFALRVVPRTPEGFIPVAPSKNAYLHWWVTPYQANSLSGHFLVSAQRLTLTKEMCVDNESPPVVCTSCHRCGHLREKCPDEIIPNMNPLPPPSKDVLSLLNHLCIEIFKTRCAEDSGIRDRMEIRDDLLMWLRQFYRDIDLHLFGSSLNGFGGKSSDIDMCLTFQSNANGEGLNFPTLVEEIQHYLKGHKNVYQLVAITTAKVPIVKFAYGRNRIQVDISLYNRLGIMNTQLLHAYSIIDARVRPLVYMMKSLAKTTGIGDASRGSLSSYAYSLMSLYFLQQVSPPVIPVLQELVDPDVGMKVETVDGANVYFYKNHEKLDNVWPHRNTNQSSLGELWLQLLEFYSSKDFHNSQRVVCIRKKDPLYKFDKLWTSTNICIEDPFDLNHNLGSGLSKRMNIFIVKTFQKAIKHFSSMPRNDSIPLEKYYFSESALSVGKPPSDRGCHFCRSIGHVQNDCPKRLMMHQRLQQRPNGRDGRDNRDGRAQRGNAQRPNQPYENFNRGGNRRDRDPRESTNRNRDPGRISNMPMMIPNAPNVPAGGIHQNAGKSTVPQNPRPVNLQNHVVVGSMKPPGFPALPPGMYGPPPRLVAPQMAPQVVQPMPPGYSIQGGVPPYLLAPGYRPPIRPPWQ
ncbi:Terminal uridylyltransferase 7 [Frankliniella fusca]|uniref:Terminal uridylyltransferase 7 n=1 Tax=Frankliniella fusca TaxID=407009 RepID=A0AAE1GU27_9NEOP|nr:Terminal uridylyltransferase 7 [Frankliniella fusca]